jgi:hypothetical protein
MQVVECERERLAVGRDSIEKLVNAGLESDTGRPQAQQRHPSEAGPDSIHRRGDVRPQPHGVVVRGVE